MNICDLENREQLKEDRRHGSPLFPLANYDNYRRFMHFSRYSIDVHWHEEVELLWLVSGRALLRIDDDSILLKQDDCAVIPPGTIHSAEAINGSPFEFETVVFNPVMLKSAEADECTVEFINGIVAGDFAIRNPLDRGGFPAFLPHMKEIIQSNEGQPFAFSLQVKGLLYTLFFELFCVEAILRKKENERTRLALERLKPALLYIKEHYSEKIKEETLATIANLSKYHFIRVFKRVTGRTPIEYINFFRILRAQKLLEQTDDKILNIAYSVGFNDLSYFYRVFEKFNGKPPGAYRD